MIVTQSRLPRRRVGLGALVALIAIGCDGGLEPAGGDGGTATVLAEIDTAFFCDVPEVVDVVLRASAIGCLDGDAGCDLADVDGTVLTCPAASPTALLAVDLQRAGLYSLSAIAHATTRDDLQVCFTTVAGDSTFELSQADVEGGAQIHAGRDAQTCEQN